MFGKFSSFLFVCILSTLFLCIWRTDDVYADIASGTYEGMSWRLTEEYELILGNGGTQTMTNNQNRWLTWPWYKQGYASQIKKVRTNGTIIVRGQMRSIFYNPKKYVEEVFDNALATGKRGCNCALFARWALRDAGYLNANEGFFYGDDDGNIHASHRAMEELMRVCDLYHVDGMKTVSDLASCGELQAGDIVVLKTGVGHTFVYAGDGMAY